MKVFVDSSFIISLLKKEDKNHKKAIKIFNEFLEKSAILYISYFIIDEAATVLSMRISKISAKDFLNSIDHKIFPIILKVDKKIRKKAYKLFKKIKDKNISIIDCYSVILMKKYKIKKCFTFDKHFEKLGFEIL